MKKPRDREVPWPDQGDKANNQQRWEAAFKLNSNLNSGSMHASVHKNKSQNNSLPATNVSTDWKYLFFCLPGMHIAISNGHKMPKWLPSSSFCLC